MRFISSLPDWRLSIATDWQDIWEDGYVERWMALHDGDCEPNVFFHPDIVRAWYLSQSRQAKPWFVTLQNECTGETIFYPFVIDNRGFRNCWLHMLVPVGYFLFDNHDPLAATGSLARKNELITAFFDLLPGMMNAYQGRLDGVDVPRQKLGLADATSSGESAPCVELSAFGNFDAYWNSLKGSVRGDVGRQRRRLSKMGSLEYREYAEGEHAEAKTAFNDFIEARSRKWKTHEVEKRFFRKLLEGALGRTVHFSALQLDGRAISWHLGFSHRGVFYYYIPAYSNEYESYSPGKVLIGFLIEKSFDSGFEKFDFLRGREKYKFDWAKQESDYFGFFFTRKGLLATSSLNCSKLLRKMRRLLVP